MKDRWKRHRVPFLGRQAEHSVPGKACTRWGIYFLVLYIPALSVCIFHLEKVFWNNDKNWAFRKFLIFVIHNPLPKKLNWNLLELAPYMHSSKALSNIRCLPFFSKKV